MSKYSDAEYLKHSYFCDRDVRIRAQSKRMVTTRKVQLCPFCPGGGKEHPPGTRMYCERAVVEDQWCSSYMCTGCMDDHIDGFAPTASEEK